MCEAASSVLVYQGRTLHSYCPPAHPKEQIHKDTNTKIQKYTMTQRQKYKNARHKKACRLGIVTFPPFIMSFYLEHIPWFCFSFFD